MADDTDGVLTETAEAAPGSEAVNELDTVKGDYKKIHAQYLKRYGLMDAETLLIHINNQISASLAESEAFIADTQRRMIDSPLLYAAQSAYSLGQNDAAESPKFMAKALRKFLKRENHRYRALYANQPARMPLNFESNSVAERHLIQVRDEYIFNAAAASGRGGGRKTLNVNEAIEVFIESRLAATVLSFDTSIEKTFVMYDYDRRMYTYDTDIPSRWVTILMGSVSSQSLKTFISTLQSLKDSLAVYNPLPRWKIAVGNGVYNTLTRSLEPHSPLYTVLNRIETNYVPTAVEPSIPGGMTFSRILSDLSNDNPARIELLLQICKFIITGYAPNPAIFIMLGSGGDGKSIFMKLMSNIVGGYNVGALNFDDMDDDSKAITAAQKRLVVGMDNSANVRIKNLAFLKSAASQEVVSFFRKYLPSVALKISSVIVELCNTLPRLTETGSSMRRRFVIFSAENSHYERGDQDFSLEESVKNTKWHEYILKTILDDSVTPYFTDFNDVDRGLLHQSLDSEDPIGVFIDELAVSGVFSHSDVIIPRTYLYAAYQDWMRQHFPGSNVHSSRTFSARTDALLREYGFVPDSRVSRLKNVERASKVSYSVLFGDYSTGEKVQEVEQQGAATRYLTRSGPVRRNPSHDVRRHSRICDVMQYFNLWQDVMLDIERVPDAYVDEFNETGVNYVLNRIDVSEPEENVTLDAQAQFDSEVLVEMAATSYGSYIFNDSSHGDTLVGVSIRDHAQAAKETALSSVSVVAEAVVGAVDDTLEPGDGKFNETLDSEIRDALSQRSEDDDLSSIDHVDADSSDEDISQALEFFESHTLDLARAAELGERDKVLKWLDRLYEVSTYGLDNQLMLLRAETLFERFMQSLRGYASSRGDMSDSSILYQVMDAPLDVKHMTLRSTVEDLIGGGGK